MKQRFFLPFFVLSCVAAAQNVATITAPVSRTVTLTADEAAIAITVAATSDSTQQQVKQALQNVGMPNPTVVVTSLGQDSSQFPPGPPAILYSATLTIPAGSATDAAKRLETLRAQLPAPLVKLQYSMTLNPSQKSVDAMRLVVMPQLMDEARKMAQSLAAVAGVKLGAVRSVSDSGGALVYAIPTAVARIGDFSQSPYLLSSDMRYTFALNVVFATAP